MKLWALSLIGRYNAGGALPKLCRQPLDFARGPELAEGLRCNLRRFNWLDANKSE